MGFVNKAIAGVLIICLPIILPRCKTRQVINTSGPGLIKDSLRVFYESGCPSGKKLDREKDIVNFMLFEEFDDTLSMFVNDKYVKKWGIYKKNNPFVSTGFSGIEFKLFLKLRHNHVRFVLTGGNKFVEFAINKRYPLYTIQRYGGIWYVNGRKCVMDLR